MIVQSTLCRGQAQAIGDAVDAWKASHEQAMRVRDLESLVRACLELEHMLQGLQREALDFLFSGVPMDTQSEASIIRKAQQIALQAFAALGGAITRAQGQGYEVDGAASFGEAHQRLQRLSGDFESRWPFIVPEEVGRARAEINRGEGLTAGEAWRELHGGPRP